ncbi:MAG TPA: hypothetical protein VK824_09425, partial [Planctomycetota bacterium]|nr:hypothetical protein [Planctomycetota bacterium]
LFQTLAYRDDPAWRAARARGPDAPVHPFYAQLAGPDVPLVLEWPPPMDYPRNELPFAQAVHDHPMKLLVRPPESPTPEPWWSDARLALRNVVVARPDVLARLPRGTAIVVHRNPSVEAGHFRAHIDGWLPPAPAHARACAEVLATLAAACGPPLLEDRYLVVFRVPGQ